MTVAPLTEKQLRMLRYDAIRNLKNWDYDKLFHEMTRRIVQASLKETLLNEELNEADALFLKAIIRELKRRKK